MSAPAPPRRALPARAKWLLPLMLLALVGLSVLRLSQPASEISPPGTLVLTGDTMGTRYTVKIAGASRVSVNREQVGRALQEVLDGVDRRMSTYRPDSELSRFNAAQTTAPIPLSRPLREVVEIALRVGKASGGALDMTVGPLVDAWGFGPSEPSPPDAAQLAELKQRVGLDKLLLTPAGLQKRLPDVRCDLSAVAKGYAVDLVRHRLRALGFRDFLVEVGGELFAEGVRADGSPWRVGIERPDPRGSSLQRAIALQDQGIATSGDYRNYREVAGKRLSHLIDPRTGHPISHPLASVSVLHEQVAMADAWATALSVLGPTQGLAVAEREHLAAQFIVRVTDDRFQTRLTTAFAARYGDD